MEVWEGQSAGQVGWVEWWKAVVEHNGLERGHMLAYTWAWGMGNVWVGRSLP
jgi:hypothetical protein